MESLNDFATEICSKIWQTDSVDVRYDNFEVDLNQSRVLPCLRGAFSLTIVSEIEPSIITIARPEKKYQEVR